MQLKQQCKIRGKLSKGFFICKVKDVGNGGWIKQSVVRSISQHGQLCAEWASWPTRPGQAGSEGATRKSRGAAAASSGRGFPAAPQRAQEPLPGWEHPAWLWSSGYVSQIKHILLGKEWDLS